VLFKKQEVPEFNLQYRTCERCGRPALLVAKILVGEFINQKELLLCPDCFAIEASLRKLTTIVQLSCGRCTKPVAFFYYVVWTVADAWCVQCAEEVLQLQIKKRNVDFF
jgi:hypothetical protein